MYAFAIGKLKILEDTTTKIQYVLHNERCLGLYYPLNNTIRNKGYLTLVSPEYINDFSILLQNATTSMKQDTDNNKRHVVGKQK